MITISVNLNLKVKEKLFQDFNSFHLLKSCTLFLYQNNLCASVLLKKAWSLLENLVSSNVSKSIIAVQPCSTSTALLMPGIASLVRPVEGLLPAV